MSNDLNQWKHASLLKLAGLSGALAIALLVGLGISAPDAACGDSSVSPAIAFQMIQTPVDLVQIFGSGISQCRSNLVAALTVGSQIDLFLFIPVYGAFLALALLGEERLRPRSTWVSICLWTTLTATLGGDIVETVSQLAILFGYGQTEVVIPILHLGNTLKTIGLALFVIGFSTILWSKSNWVLRISALVLAGLGLLRLAGYVVESLRSFAPVTALFIFVTMWAVGLLQLFARASLAQSTSSPKQLGES